MLQETQRMSAPSAVSVSISPPVWIVMCSEPAMRAPFKGCFGPYSSRVAIRPGISVSASESSLRPNSARPMSLTMYSVAGALLALAVMTVPDMRMNPDGPENRPVTWQAYSRGSRGRQDRYKDIFICIAGALMAYSSQKVDLLTALPPARAVPPAAATRLPRQPGLPAPWRAPRKPCRTPRDRAHRDSDRR